MSMDSGCTLPFECLVLVILNSFLQLSVTVLVISLAIVMGAGIALDGLEIKMMILVSSAQAQLGYGFFVVALLWRCSAALCDDDLLWVLLLSCDCLLFLVSHFNVNEAVLVNLLSCSVALSVELRFVIAVVVVALVLLFCCLLLIDQLIPFVWASPGINGSMLMNDATHSMDNNSNNNDNETRSLDDGSLCTKDAILGAP